MSRRAEVIVNALLEGGVAPAPTKPTIAPPKPGTPKPKPGGKPWNPTPRPGVTPRPKAREREGSSTAPPPTIIPIRPPVRTNPGTRPWRPKIRPGIKSPPKGRDEKSFAEAEGSVPVPPPASEDQPETQPEPAPIQSLCDYIRPGDRVMILTPHNQHVTGRAVMRNRQQGCWVLNAGGPHGRPVIASEENIVSIRRGGKVIYGK